MRALHWLAGAVLLVLMILGVGMVMFFVYGGAKLSTAAIGASFAVLAWHGLRRTGPRVEYDDPREEWIEAICVVGVVAAVIALGFWNPWLILFGWLVFPLWLKLVKRS